MIAESTRKSLLNGTERAIHENSENMVNVAVFFGANSATAQVERAHVNIFAHELAHV